jgi:hypothetical protein
MSDIVTEMRNASELRGDTYSSMEIWGLLGRGAAEIEQLREHNKIIMGRDPEEILDSYKWMRDEIKRLEFRIKVEQSKTRIWDEEAARLKAEIERLKAAHIEVKSIALQAEVYHKQLGAPATFVKIAEVARRALEGK